MKRIVLFIILGLVAEASFAQITGSAFVTKYNDSGTGLYRAGQAAGSIGSDDHRSLVNDLNASVPFLANTSNTFTGTQVFGSGTPITSGLSSTVIYSGSAASGNKIAQAVNVRQSVASTGVHFGDYVKAYSDHTTGTVNQLLAIQGNAENANAGTVTNARGVLGGTTTTNGPVTNAIGVKAEGIFISGNAAVTNSYGLHVSGATIGSGSVTNNFGIFQSGSTVVNEFEGTTQLNQVPLSPGGVVYSSTYTPTVTSGSNVAASSGHVTSYMRVGNYVTISGQVEIDVTSNATLSVVTISLPVSSNFSTGYEAGGTGVCVTAGVTSMPMYIWPEPTTDTLQMLFTSTTTNSVTFSFTVGYTVQ